jgi:hypothetical protein
MSASQARITPERGGGAGALRLAPRRRHPFREMRCGTAHSSSLDEGRRSGAPRRPVNPFEEEEAGTASMKGGAYKLRDGNLVITADRVIAWPQ